jgi:hypothetical protein
MFFMRAETGANTKICNLLAPKQVLIVIFGTIERKTYRGRFSYV